MTFARWESLTDEQKRVIHSLRRHWKPDEFKLFQYKLRKDGDVSRRKGDHEPTPEYNAALDKMLRGEDVRSKGDNREWKPGVTFHFGRD